MKQIGKRLIEAAVFLGLLGVSLFGLSLLFHPKDNREDYGIGEMKANGILAEPENSIDVSCAGRQ